jgi:predicted RNase H-like nuclease (RuvC/YqgF family)
MRAGRKKERVMETNRSLEVLEMALERLAGAASALEQTVVRLEEQQGVLSGQVQKIVATVEQGGEMSEGCRVAELERKLHEAEAKIAALQAGMDKAQVVAGQAGQGRKTVSTATMTLLAKQGIANLESIEAGALDAALNSLSMEQRIAVKSQLFRAGLLS